MRIVKTLSVLAVLLALGTVAVAHGGQILLNAAGATFPYPIYSKWFDQRSKALRAELAVRQKRLSDFENANGIVATDEKLDVETSRLNELSTQLVAIQGERQESQSRLHQTGGSNESLEEVLASPVIAK